MGHILGHIHIRDRVHYFKQTQHLHRVIEIVVHQVLAETGA
jgi:hypothetical protein